MMKANLMVAMVCAVAALTLIGCPTAPGTFELWVINTSGEVTVTNVKLVDNANEDNNVEFSEDLAASMARVSTNIPLGAFEGGTITVEVTGETSGDILEDVDAEVSIPDSVQSGSVFIVVLSGDNILTFDADYIPLEDMSKGELMFRNHLLGAI